MLKNSTFVSLKKHHGHILIWIVKKILGIGSITCKVSMIKIWCKLLQKYFACLKHSKPYCGHFFFGQRSFFYIKCASFSKFKMILANLMNKGAKWVEFMFARHFGIFHSISKWKVFKVYELGQKNLNPKLSPSCKYFYSHQIQWIKKC